ncbi:MAG: hypothetical protein HZB47_09270 [Nitrosomonadales bacterium]|nr:hypothetical protein [Nitrosomonadales bacterium]
MFKRNFIGMLAVVCLGFGTSAALAEQRSDWSFDGSGFLTIGAGVMLGGTRGPVLDKQCPCFIADYAQNAIYDGRGGLQFGPDSKLGLQGTATLPDPRFSVTAQVVSRGSENGKVDLEWLYGTYRVTDNTSIQAGRKRLPMFYYSDSQDVGFSLPWTHLPPQLYGWEAVNYNGVNLQHRDQWDEWDVSFNILAGSEHARNSGYWKIYNGQTSRTDVDWENIAGGNMSFSRDWFETRLAYIQSDTYRHNANGVWDSATQTLVAASDPFLTGNVTRQKIWTAAFNVDYADWVLTGEFLYIDRPGALFKDHANRLGIGHRFGDWEATANVSEYYSEAVTEMGADPLGQESHSDRSLTVRHFLTPQSDIKLQLDVQHDRGGVNWSPRYGDARLLTMAYDRIF